VTTSVCVDKGGTQQIATRHDIAERTVYLALSKSA
jgi:hypothetical protein